MEKIKLLDEDGYPTQEALIEVARFDAIQNIDGFLSLIKSLWSYPDRFVLKDGTLYLSTGGWSGNESVVEAMKQNFFFFVAHTKWERGGHFWFSLKVFKNNERKLICLATGQRRRRKTPSLINSPNKTIAHKT